MDAPQLFHNKPDREAPYAVFPLSIMKDLLNTLSGNELKVMLAYLSCKGDGSFSPSSEYMLQMTGIKNPTHYFRARRGLIAKGYAKLEKGELTIDVRKIVPSESESKGESPASIPRPSNFV